MVQKYLTTAWRTRRVKFSEVFVIKVWGIGRGDLQVILKVLVKLLQAGVRASTFTFITPTLTLHCDLDSIYTLTLTLHSDSDSRVYTLTLESTLWFWLYGPTLDSMLQLLTLHSDSWLYYQTFDSTLLFLTLHSDFDSTLWLDSTLWFLTLHSASDSTLQVESSNIRRFYSKRQRQAEINLLDHFMGS